MPNLDQLEQEVDSLHQLRSDIFSFGDALSGLTEAARTTAEGDLPRLRNILSTYRGKLPNLPTYKRVRADAKDLADTLMLATLAGRIARISARNETLATLTSQLKRESDKANRDATLLTRITEAVDKATKTVEEVKEMIDALTATNATTKDRLKALVETLGDISSIFKPEDED